MGISGMAADVHLEIASKSLVTTSATTQLPEQEETIHMIQMLRKEAHCGGLEDLAHVKSADCLADS